MESLLTSEINHCLRHIKKEDVDKNQDTMMFILSTDISKEYNLKQYEIICKYKMINDTCSLFYNDENKTPIKKTKLKIAIIKRVKKYIAELEIEIHDLRIEREFKRVIEALNEEVMELSKEDDEMKKVLDIIKEIRELEQAKKDFLDTIFNDYVPYLNE